MITRSQMRRQLRAQGGIMNVEPRKKFGVGSVFQDFKDKVVDRTRKIIPNELANVAVKAAPFVAMIPGYGPAAAGIMRGLGRLDQRGNLTDAVKQGLLFYGGGKAFGAGMEKAGLRDPGASGIGEFFNEGARSKAGSLFKSQEAAGTAKTASDAEKGVGIIKTATDATIGKIPGLKALPPFVQQQLFVGGVTAGASALASYFQGDFREQEPGETMEEYLAARKDVVGKQMRVYMDNYYANDPEYSALDDAGRNAFVARYNVRDGGRIGYQVGGISSANTLAENIARNRANQSFIKQFFQPAGVQMTYTGTPSADKIAKEGFKAGRPTGGFKLRAADLFQKGPKTFTTPNIDVAKTYGKTIPVLSSTGNVRLPSGGIPGSTLGQAIKNIGQTKFGTEVIQTPEQATKGMQLAKKAQDRATRGVSSAAKRLVAGETVKGLGSKVGLGTLAKNVLGRANLPLTVGMTAFDIAKETPTIQKVGTSIGEGLYNLLNPEAATPTPDAGTDRPTMADVAGPAKTFTPDSEGFAAYEGIVPGFKAKKRSDGRFEYKAPDGQIYGPDTYTDIAVGKYPNIYDPNRPTMADVAGPTPPTMLSRSDFFDQADSWKEWRETSNKLQEEERKYYENLGNPGGSYNPDSQPEYLKNLRDKKRKLYAQTWNDYYEYETKKNKEFKEYEKNLASGGRVGLMGGAMPTGIMRSNKAGVMERDYRDEGGFVPVGIKEKADDVPAMLSKNEFVFTADAVRGAGNGSIEKGAQKMYDTMKNLERRVV